MSLAPSPLLQPGRPWPLGASLDAGGLNIAVWAPDATCLQLCLFDAEGREELAQLDLPVCSDGVWHGLLPFEAQPAGLTVGPGLVYGLRADGPWAPERGHRFNPAKLLLDPWAQEVVGHYGRDPRAATDAASATDVAALLELYVGHDPADPRRPDPRDNAAVALKARLPVPWPAATLPPGPRVPADRRLICEVHVKGATMRHPDVPAALRGSYAGLAHPALIEHWQRLGVTTLSLLPVHHRADEARLQQLGLSNYWGYSSIAFLAPETRYWSGRSGTTPNGEFRAMVEALHGAGLEVVLDVVFNHSAETDEAGPTLSLRGLANTRYYRLDPADRSRYVNWSGCGNCLDLTEPRVVELVLGSLRHWVLQHGVDGFRFDLAPILARDPQGGYSRLAPFFAALQSDPVLSRVLLIAEPWDIGPGGYQLGAFAPGWLEWNDQFRDTMRAWWLRGGSDRGQFVHRWAGSSAQFHHDGRAPLASVNFISAHDGFTLRDLVSFDHKHNEANGEHNRDGHHHNCSWNGGVEGPTTDAAVLQRRQSLSRALLATLLLAQGTPMLLAGDELGHSQQGNNNAYCQDNALTWLDWPNARTDSGADLCDCVASLAALRRALPALRLPHWLARRDVRWRAADGRELSGDAWPRERTLMIELGAELGQTGVTDAAAMVATILLLINPETSPRRFDLPVCTPSQWWPVWDSRCIGGRPEPELPCVDPSGSCLLGAHGLLVLVAAPQAPEALLACSHSDDQERYRKTP